MTVLIWLSESWIFYLKSSSNEARNFITKHHVTEARQLETQSVSGTPVVWPTLAGQEHTILTQLPKHLDLVQR